MLSKAFLIAVALFGLASCESAEEYQARHAAEAEVLRLPEGCEFRDAGSYAGDSIYVVTCESRDTQMISHGECRMVGKIRTCYTVTTAVVLPE